MCEEVGVVYPGTKTNAVEHLCEYSSEDIKQEQVEGIGKVYVFGLCNMSQFSK